MQIIRLDYSGRFFYVLPRCPMAPVFLFSAGGSGWMKNIFKHVKKPCFPRTERLEKTGFFGV